MIALKKTANAKGTPVPGSPDETTITFRVTLDHHKRIRDIAVKNHRSISQECYWRVLASIENEEKGK